MSNPNDETPLMGSNGKRQYKPRLKTATTPEVDTLRRSQRRPITPAEADAATAAAFVDAVAATKAWAERKAREKAKGKAAAAAAEEEEEPSEPQPLPARMARLGPGQGLGCEAAVGSLTPSRSREYKLCSKHTEGKRPLYAIGFNFIDARYYDVFATVGGNRVTTYRGLPDGNLAVLQAYIDGDNAQSFYTLSWACDLDGTPLLVAAGSNAVIRVINCATEKLFKTFLGHGDSINEIRTQPLKPSLFISASKDESVRLWNVHTGICILIFAGGGGHRNEVLSVDFHPSDIYRIASCGMDNTVKIWSMKEFWPYVEKSFTWTDLPSKFPTKYVQFPLMTSVVHSNYVDCTRWLGDFILSKSVDNEIVLWEPKTKEQGAAEGSIDVLQKYPVPDCDIWFIKFSCDFHFNQLAIGNREGKIYVWEVQTSPPVLITRLSSPQCKMPIRQTAVSFDGSTILACGEDGSIYRWDEVEHQSVKN
ncbi:polycomb group protein FIE1 [Hordeum vulgare subsp. vulgare]|nr:polycomb group protein FIE1 [Hordeum vulgare subsp. vulgare]